MILRGVIRAAGECTDELWSPEHGRAVFGRFMSLSLFKLIRGVLRFDNVETRQGCLARDKLAAVRMLLDDFVEHSKLAYVPGSSITVDKQLFPYRRALQIPAIYAFKTGEVRPQILAGLRFREITNLLFYCHNLPVYCGREDIGDPEVSLGERAVLPFTGDLRNSGTVVT